MSDSNDPWKSNSIAKLLAQIEQNTRSEQTAVLYKSRKQLGLSKVTVKIRANIYAITDIDNVKQEFTANLSIRARWKEPLFYGKLENDEIDWDDQWNPRLELENAVEVKNLDRKYELRYFAGDKADKIPHVCLTMNISATFKEMFELEMFPFDYQALNVWLISEWPFEQLELVKDDEYMDCLVQSTFTESKEWKLYPQIIGEPVGSPDDVDEVFGSPDQYPLYTVTVHVKRLHIYYVLYHIVHMVMLFLVSLLTFSIPCTQVAQRITANALIIICSLVYRLVMHPYLPLISYWTVMDKFILSLAVGHALIIIEHGIIGGIAQTSVDADTIFLVDLACLAGIFAIMLILLLYYTSIAYQTVSTREKFLNSEFKRFTELNEKILHKNSGAVYGKWKLERPGDDSTKQSDLQKHALNYVKFAGSRTSLKNPSAKIYPSQLPQQLPLIDTRLSEIKFPYQAAPQGATHEVQMKCPPEVVIRSRSRSNSRSRSRRNSITEGAETD